MNVDLAAMGRNIYKLRRNADDEIIFTQDDVANHLHINRSKVADWETGRATPTIHDIVNLADMLGTSCDMILRGNKPEFLGIHRHTGFSNRAIEILKFYMEHGYGPIRLNEILSAFVESDIIDDFIETLAYYRGRIPSEEFKTDLELEFAAYELSLAESAMDIGCALLTPGDARSYYLHKLADLFVHAITTETTAKKTSKRKKS